MKNIFEHSDFDQDGKINYKQWVTTDVTTLIKIHSINSRWIRSDCNWDDIWLVPSPFYKGLTSFLHYKIQKKILTAKSVLLWWISQKIVVYNTGSHFYWQNSHAMLHPFVVYYRDWSTNELRCGSYSAISGHLRHNQTTVNCFLTNFFKLGFSPCKAERPLRGMELQKRKHNKIIALRKSV